MVTYKVIINGKPAHYETSHIAAYKQAQVCRSVMPFAHIRIVATANGIKRSLETIS